jgi:hypothetical protein
MGKIPNTYSAAKKTFTHSFRVQQRKPLNPVVKGCLCGVSSLVFINVVVALDLLHGHLGWTGAACCVFRCSISCVFRCRMLCFFGAACCVFSVQQQQQQHHYIVPAT